MNQIKYIGFAWYRPEDFERLKTLFIDGHKLHASYQQWLQASKKGVQEMTAKGYTVEKVYIDPDTFLEWCSDRGLNIDSHGRSEFVNAFLGRKYAKKN
jgi:hypothetical protein